MSHGQLDHSAVLLCLCLAVGMSSGAQAQQATRGGNESLPNQLSLTLGGELNDNVDYAAKDGISGKIGSLGLNGLLSGRTRLLRADLGIGSRFEHYLNNEYDDQVIGGLNGNLVFSPIPGRFEWVTEEYFSQYRLLPRAADSPGNRQNFNFVSTGPEVTVAMGTATSLHLSGNVANSYYESSEGDSNSLGGKLFVARQLSDVSALSVNYEQARFEYDGDSVNDFDRQNAFVRYQLGSQRTRVEVDVGEGRVSSDFSSNANGFLWRALLQRRLTSSSTVIFRAGSEFLAGGENLRGVQYERDQQPGSNAVLSSSSAFERRLLLLRWDFQRNRTGFGVRGERNEEKYVTASSQDRTLDRYSISVNRTMARAVEARLEALYTKEVYPFEKFEATEQSGVASVTWRFGRAFSTRAQYELTKRESSDGKTDYTQGRTGLFLIWNPVGAR